MKIKEVKNDLLKIIDNLEMLGSTKEIKMREVKMRKKIRKVINAGLNLSMLITSKDNEEMNSEVFTCVMMFYQMVNMIIEDLGLEVTNS